MPELPDVTIYIEAIAKRVVGQRLQKIRIASPFLLRTFDPPPAAFAGKATTGVSRIGKRIVLEFERDLFAVIHLMIAGRFKWLAPAAKIPGKIGLAAFDYEHGSLILTEAGSKKRASLHLFDNRAATTRLDPGGVEVLGLPLETFRDVLLRERHTLKRTLTDPHLFSGIGNAYSDEILHRAQLSPVQLNTNLSDEEIARLHRATQDVLSEWIETLRAETGEGFPEKVTAFRADMAVHGKFEKPCPVCGAPVQRIVYADNETNYCARCQTGGRRLADRALSRLLGSDWPRTLDE